MAEGLTALFALPRAALTRMAVLEAVGELGSIRAAAQRVDLSYRGAWDAVQALNNLFDTPLLIAAPGGRSGGAAHITPRGLAVLSAFHRFQAETSGALSRLDRELGLDVFWSLGMKTSARNVLRGQIVRILTGAVNVEVGLKISDDLEIVAVITSPSVEDLELRVGSPAIALIKSSFIILAGGENLRTSARNQIAGTVISREDGAVNSDVRLDIGHGKTLAATVTLESAIALDIAVGNPLTALIKASHIILAIE